MVESGFSKMKYFENEYRGNLRLDMYNAYRIIADNNFDRETFEEFNNLHSLVESVKNANKRYKEVEQNRLTNEIATEEATNLRAEVLVFKRRTNKELVKELKRVRDEVDEAESALAKAKRRRSMLELAKTGAVVQLEQTSENIVSSFFKKQFCIRINPLL